MGKVRICTTASREKCDAVKEMGYEISYILDQALDQYIKGIIVNDTTVISRLIRERKALLNEMADLSVKESALRAKRERLESEVKALSEEIGIIEKVDNENTQSDRITELLRNINSVIIDENYNIKKVTAACEDDINEIKKLMPAFNLKTQIETMKGFSA
jgi:predicted ribosome quality control (RQC) complex YloA/Tae2 family protein